MHAWYARASFGGDSQCHWIMHATNCIKISATLRSLRAEIRKSSGATPSFPCPPRCSLDREIWGILVSEWKRERETAISWACGISSHALLFPGDGGGSLPFPLCCLVSAAFTKWLLASLKIDDCAWTRFQFEKQAEKCNCPPLKGVYYFSFNEMETCLYFLTWVSFRFPFSRWDILLGAIKILGEH